MRGFLRDWRDWWWIASLCGAVLGFISTAVYYQMKYIEEHHCLRTGNEYTSTTIIYQKIGNTEFPQFIDSTRYEYECDGGERRWF